MEIFENAMDKARETMDVATAKANEVITVQKQKFEIATLKTKRNKDFELLGKLYFKKLKGVDTDDEAIELVVNEITDKTREIKRLRAEIDAVKNGIKCPECDSLLEEDAEICPVCGAKIDWGIKNGC